MVVKVRNVGAVTSSAMRRLWLWFWLSHPTPLAYDKIRCLGRKKKRHFLVPRNQIKSSQFIDYLATKFRTTCRAHILYLPLAMARKSKKPASGGSEAPNSKSDNFASFDEQALSALTAKIEQEFGKTKSEHERQPDTINRSRKHEKSGTDVKVKAAKGKVRTQELARGTKRDAHGNTKLAGKAAANSQPGPTKQRSVKGMDDRAVLLEEILALGGTEEDLDLVADVVSDEEDEESNSTKPADKSFRKDLASFVAALGIEGDIQEDDADSIADEEADDGWEEASDPDSSRVQSEEITEAPTKKAKLSSPEAQLSINPNRLVSISLSYQLG